MLQSIKRSLESLSVNSFGNRIIEGNVKSKYIYMYVYKCVDALQDISIIQNQIQINVAHLNMAHCLARISIPRTSTLISSNANGSQPWLVQVQNRYSHRRSAY